jgi:6-phosphogluconolactonase (cycloisomerase 2 family)
LSNNKINTRSFLVAAASLFLIFSLAACGGNSSSAPIPPANYVIGGQVSGLNAGGQLVLSDNGSDTLTVVGNGAFYFAKSVQAKSGYAATVQTQPTGETCMIANSSGASVAGNVTNVAVTCVTNTYTVGGAVTGLATGTQITLFDGTNTLTVAANGTFTLSTPVAYNGSYGVAVTNTTGRQICDISNAFGTAVQAKVTNVEVSCWSFSEFAYVTNTGQPGSFGTLGSIAAYIVNPASGTLVPVKDGLFSAGQNPVGLVVDPTGRFAYTPSHESAGISAYTIDANTGLLAPIAGSPFAGSGALPVTFDPTGKFLYVATYGGGTILAYTVDPVSGALTQVTGSPFTAGPDAFQVVIDPTGRFAYCPNLLGNDVSAYTIDSTSGSLTAIPGAPFAAPYNPTAMTIDPTGKFAFVSSVSSTTAPVISTFQAYAIDATSGALTPLPGSPFMSGSPTVDPTGKFVYATSNAGGIAGYSIDATTNTLTPMSGSPFPPVANVGPVTIDPTGKFAFVAAGSYGIAAYTIDAASGVLTPVAGSPFNFSTPRALFIDPSGLFLYAPSDSLNGAVFAFAIDATTGALTPVPGSPFAAGSIPSTITFVKVR